MSEVVLDDPCAMWISLVVYEIEVICKGTIAGSNVNIEDLISAMDAGQRPLPENMEDGFSSPTESSPCHQRGTSITAILYEANVLKTFSW